MVVFRNNKPVCQLSAVENSHLVPSYFPVASQDHIQLRLPICNRRYASQIRDITTKGFLLDKKGAYNIAGPPVVAGAICLGAAALSYYATSEITTAWEQRMGALAITLSPFIFAIGIAAGEFSPNRRGLKFTKGLLKGTGVAGLCGGATTAIVFVYRFIR